MRVKALGWVQATKYGHSLHPTGKRRSTKSDQRKTLIGLGLNKINRTSVLEDTPSVRGMVSKVKHLVKVVDEN